MFQEKNLCFCCLICFQIVYQTLSFMFRVNFRLSIMTCFCGQNDFFFWRLVDLRNQSLLRRVHIAFFCQRKAFARLWEHFFDKNCIKRKSISASPTLSSFKSKRSCTGGREHLGVVSRDVCGMMLVTHTVPRYLKVYLLLHILPLYIYHIYSIILYPNPVYLSRFSPFWKRKNLGKTTAKITPLPNRHVPMKKTHIYIYTYIYIYIIILYTHIQTRVR